MRIHRTKKSIQTIELRNITMRYEDQTLFDKVQFNFRKGCTYWLRGDVASGKTTMLKLLAGLVEPTDGDYFINGESVHENSFEDFLPYRMNIGMSFGHGGLLNNRTLQDNVTLPLLYHDILSFNDAKEHVKALMEEFHLTRFAHLRPASAPVSVQKMTNILRAFVMYPEIVLMDDPTSSLSPEYFDLLTEWIGRYRIEFPHTTIVIATDSSRFMSRIPSSPLSIQNMKLTTEQTMFMQGGAA